MLDAERNRGSFAESRKRPSFQAEPLHDDRETADEEMTASEGELSPDGKGRHGRSFNYDDTISATPYRHYEKLPER